MVSSAVATTNDGTQYEKHILRLGVDLGTGHLSIDGQHVQGDHYCNSFPLRLKGRYGGPSIKQIAIHEANGNVIYGLEEVTKAVRDDPELRDEEIERFKLALHPESADLEEVKHVKRVLGSENDRGALQIFNSDLFRTITKDVRTLFAHYHNAGMDAGYWNSIPVEFQISVPAMWDDDARGVIRNAAKHGGAWRAELRLEPLCIATPQMVHLVKDRNIKIGQCLLLLDCGQGTWDIATIKLVREASVGHLMELQRVGNCSGNAAGSHKVNTAAEKWVLSGACTETESHGGFNETCKQLGMSKRGFLRAFSDEIDKVKVDIDKQTLFDVRIYGLHGVVRPGSLYQLTISIPRDTLMLWYKTWTDPAKQLLEHHLSTQTTSSQFAWALFTGGGAESPQFCTEMETVLSKYQIPVGDARSCISACSAGALLQHFFQEDGLPPNAHFHISQTESYDRYKHLGAVRDNLRLKSEFERKEDVVHDRLVTVGRSSGQQDFTSKGYFPQEFYVEAADKLARIHFDLFWSEEPVPQHCALVDARGNRRDGVRSYPLMFVDPDDFEGRGFKVLHDKENHGKPYFIVEGFVKMEGTSERLVLKVFLMQHSYEFPKKCTEPAPKKRKRKRTDDIDEHIDENIDEQPFEDDRVLHEYIDEVWHKNCSHFVSSNTGVTRPHFVRQGGPVESEGTRRSGRVVRGANTGGSD